MSSEMLKVLEMVEAGKITPEEAEKLLKALNENNPIGKSGGSAQKPPDWDSIEETINKVTSFVPEAVSAAMAQAGLSTDEEKEYSFRGMKRLSVKLASGDLSISEAEDDNLRISASGMHKINQGEGMVKLRVVSGDAEIAIPEDTESDITIDSGDVEIDSLSGKSLNLTIGSGDVEGEMECGISKITIGSGDVELDYDNFEKSIITIGSGDAEIAVPDKVALSLDIDPDADLELPESAKIIEDKIENEGKKSARRKMLVHIGENPDKEMKLSIGSGDVSIEEN